MVKNLPAVQETQETRVRSLGLEDSLEKEMATHSSILAWRIPWNPGGLHSSSSHKESDTTKHLYFFTLSSKESSCHLGRNEIFCLQ